MTLLEPLDKPPQADNAAGFVSRDGEDAIARQLLRPFFLSDREVVILAGFDAYGRLVGLETATGDVAGRCVIPTAAWHNLLARRVVAVVMAHNHPSGEAHPSDADLRCTREAAQFLRLVGIDLVDHLIFVESGHFSFRNAQMI